jgi:hypothetical protein
MKFCAAKKELVDLVNSYATRHYDEDLVASDKLGGTQS